MTRAGTRRREEPPAAKASGTTGSAGGGVKEPEGLKGEQAEGIREKRLRCGACGPASADGFAVLQSSFAKRCLRLEVCFGVFCLPAAFPFCGFSGEYETRVVQGSRLCCAGRDGGGGGGRSRGQHRGEHASLQAPVGRAG